MVGPLAIRRRSYRGLARVDDVPLEIGDWKAEIEESERSAFLQAGAMATGLRKYTHASSKHSLLVILMCGRAGRMSAHTPEVCYQGAGYKLVGTRKASA